MMDWDDVRFALAIARTGTLSAAARMLKVNQTTVARRLAGLEEAVATPLFTRTDSGLMTTEAGEDLIRHAERMEEEMTAALHRLNHGGAAVRGVVRVTAVESVLTHWVVPGLTRLYQTYPDLRLELIASQSTLNLTRREADIALRLAQPQGAGLKIRRLADLPLAVFGPAAKGPDLPWLAYDDSLQDIPEARWLSRRLAEEGAEPVLRASSALVLMAAIRAGLGRAVLPCHLAQPDPALRQWGEPVLTRPLWLAVQEDVARSRRVRVVADWLAEQIKTPGSRASLA